MHNYGKYGPFKQPPAMGRELAKRVVLLRKQKGYSQAELARRSGVSLSSLRRFEQTGKISLDNLLHISQLLGRMIDFDDLLAPINDIEEFRDRLFYRTIDYYD